jgi:hypothetical protein
VGSGAGAHGRGALRPGVRPHAVRRPAPGRTHRRRPGVRHRVLEVPRPPPHGGPAGQRRAAARHGAAVRERDRRRVPRAEAAKTDAPTTGASATGASATRATTMDAAPRRR